MEVGPQSHTRYKLLLAPLPTLTLIGPSRDAWASGLYTSARDGHKWRTTEALTLELQMSQSKSYVYTLGQKAGIIYASTLQLPRVRFQVPANKDQKILIKSSWRD